MIDVKKAYSIIEQQYPKMEANTCNEYENEYVFSLKPKGCKELFVNSAVYVVNKETGNYRVTTFWEYVGKSIVREIDVTTLK